MTLTKLHRARRGDRNLVGLQSRETTLAAGLIEAIVTGAPVVVAEYLTAVATACQVPHDLALLTILGKAATVVALALDTRNDVPPVLFRDSRKSNDLHAHGRTLQSPP